MSKNNTIEFDSYIGEDTEVHVTFDWEPSDPDVGILSEIVEIWSIKIGDVEQDLEQLEPEDLKRLEDEAYDRLRDRLNDVEEM